MKELIEQIKKELLYRIKIAYERMYKYKENTYDVYYGEKEALQDFLAYITQLGLSMKEEEK